MEFNQPAEGGDRFPFIDHVGALVLFAVREYKTGVTTTFGEKDAVAADIHVIDGPSAGQVFGNSLIFGGAVIGALKSFVGGAPVLARIGQGVAKPGQKPPYVLNPFTQADQAVALAYWARVQMAQVQQPAQQAPAPAPQQQYQPAPAAAPAQQYQPAPAAAQQQYAPPAAPSEADKFMGYPPDVQLVLVQSGSAPQLTPEQFAALSEPIQRAFAPAPA